MPAIVKHLEPWKKWMQVHGMSAATLQSYGYQIKHFAAFCSQEGIRAVEDVDREALRRYWNWLKSSPKKFSLHSLGVKCRATKSLFAFLEAEGVLAVNPAHVLKNPSTKGLLPKRAPRHEEIMRLLSAPRPDTRQGQRDRAALELAYSTGLRVGEIEGLSVYDVDLAGGVVAVRQGKGRKDRLCPLGIHAARALRVYLDQARPVYRQASEESTDALFLNNRGRRWDRGTIQWVLRRYRKQAGLSGRVTVHGLRRGMATGMISRMQKAVRGEAADMATVAAILGHVRLETTARYAQVLAEDLQDAHQSAHPRARTTDAVEDAFPELKARR